MVKERNSGYQSFNLLSDHTTDSEQSFFNPYQHFKQQLVRVQALDTLQISRAMPLVERDGCTTQLRIVIEGSDSREFRKRKAALQALDRLYENNYVSALAFVVNEFADSDDVFKQFLARKAKEHLQK